MRAIFRRPWAVLQCLICGHRPKLLNYAHIYWKGGKETIGLTVCQRCHKVFWPKPAEVQQ